jgi:YHS domain-containing protein/thiol-disulfide isomerase/thioredoxin
MLLCGLLSLPARAQSVAWQQSLETAQAAARHSGRLVLVHFYTDSCPPCEALEQNVFNQPSVATAIAARFVPVKLNADQNQATAASFGITRVPTDVVLTPDGQVIGKLISPPTPTGYIAELTQVAHLFASQSGTAVGGPSPGGITNGSAAPSGIAAANVAGNRTIPGNPAPPSTVGSAAAGPPNINPAYNGLPVSPTTAPAAMVPQQPATGDRYSSVPFSAPPLPGRPTVPALPVSTSPPSMGSAAQPGPGTAAMTAAQPKSAGPVPPAQSPPAIVDNRYALAAPGQTPVMPAATGQLAGARPTAGAPMTNQFAMATGVPTPPLPQQPQFPQQQAFSPAAAPAATIAPSPAAPHSAAGMSISGAPPAAAAPQSAAAVPDPRQLPPGAPPLGFDGYCPVSMRNLNLSRWVAGDPRWGAIHRDRTYWFAGQREQQQFLANPDLYAPALSGMDSVMAVDHRQQVPGKREHSIDYDNTFYLFSSEATLQQFTANPERYAVPVRQALNIQPGRTVR